MVIDDGEGDDDSDNGDSDNGDSDDDGDGKRDECKSLQGSMFERVWTCVLSPRF